MKAFARLLHAEWTKLRTVPGWVIGTAAGVLAIVGLGLLPGMQGSCGRHGPESECRAPVGPEGQQVTDSFTFVHQALTGDGAITARVTSLTGLISQPDGPAPRSGLVPWAKAGLIVKDGTGQGSSYAAVMVTGGHGVRMQDNYVHDRAGWPGAVTGASPRWLRLVRTGNTITGYESVDGMGWTLVGSAVLKGLPATVQAGLFVTSPQYAQAVRESLATSGAGGGPTQATAAFDRLDHQGTRSGGAWVNEIIGGSPHAPELGRGRVEQAGDGFRVTGSGDIAPAVAGAAGAGTSITQTLVGTFAGLIFMVVVGTLFVTAEYRRGLIRTTLTASPPRGRVLAAKALIVGAVTYLAGLVAAAVVVIFGQRVLRGNGVYVLPASTATELRVVAGTAALLAVAAVLALAIGAVLRRSAAAVAAAIVGTVLPYLLAVSVLPTGAAQWLLRVTPAAAFAVQQSVVQYPQVDNVYTPAAGYFPLAPWNGFAVLAGWTALTLGLAMFLLRRRDA